MSHVRTARSAAIASLLLLAVLCACGEDEQRPRIAWAQAPEVTRPEGIVGDRILTGRIENRSSGLLELTADDIRVEDQVGNRLPSSVAFLVGYVHSVNPPDRDALADLPGAERQRLGALVSIESGQTTPLMVSWRTRRPTQTAARLVTPAGSLSLP